MTYMKAFRFCAIAALFVVTSCAHYKVEPTTSGYVLNRIPAEVMQGFPGKHRVEVGLDDPKKGKTAVTGIATKSGEHSLRIETDDRFSFEPVRNETWLMMRSRQGTARPGRWSGCVRDATLRAHRGNQRLCWCWSDLTLSP